jgi:hypothetical protein
MEPALEKTYRLRRLGYVALRGAQKDALAVLLGEGVAGREPGPLP